MEGSEGVDRIMVRKDRTRTMEEKQSNGSPSASRGCA